MAKKIADIEAVINVKVNDGEIDELSSKLKNAQKIIDKNGVVYKVNVDEKGLTNLINTVKNINKNGANSITLDFDEKASLEKLGKTEASIMKQFDNFAQKIRDTLNNAISEIGTATGGSKLGGDISSSFGDGLNDLENRINKLNETIKEKQSLLDETQSKIDNQANAEIEAIKRVQKVHEEWQNKETKVSAEKYAAEYQRYTEVFDDDSKLAYTGANGRKKTSEGISQDFYDILDEYEISDEKLDKLVENINKKQGKLIDLDEDSLNNYKNIVENLKTELKSLIAERDSLVKEFNELNKQQDVKSTVNKVDNSKKVSNTTSISKDKNVDVDNSISGLESEIESKLQTIKVKIEPIISSDFYSKIENGGIANIKFTANESSILNFYNDIEAYSERGIYIRPIPYDVESFYENIEKYRELRLKVSPINESDKNIEDIKVDESKLQSLNNTSFENIESTINNLISSINFIGTAFSLSTDDIISDSNRQVESIKSIKTVVDELGQSLKNTGVKTVDEFANFQKEFAKLQQEQEKLNKQKEEFERKQAEAKNKQDSPANKLTGSEMVDAKNKIVEAAEKTKNVDLDLSSIKFDKDGVMSFKAVVEETSDAITIAEYKIKDFNKAVTAGGKLSKKYLDNNTVNVTTKEKSKTESDTIKSLEEQFTDAVNKTKNFSFDADSLKIDSSGIITFTRTIQEAGEEAKKVEYQIQSLADVMNKSGSIKQSFVKNGGTDITGREEIQKLTDEYLKAIELRRKIEESGTISTSAGVSRRDSALKEEVELESKLSDMIKSRNLSLEETEAIQKQITEAKEKELKLYNATDNNQNKIDKEQVKYDKYAGNVNPNDYSDLDMVIGGQVVNVRNKIIELQTAATTAMDSLRAGAFDSKEGFDQTATSLDKTLALLKELSSDKYKNINKKGDLLGTFDIDKKLIDMDQSDIKNNVKEVLSQYNQVVKDIKVTKGGSAATANVINDGQIKKVTIALEEYQSELDQTAVKVRALSGAEEQYQTSATKWINGMKTKMHSLTQYVTGLDLVMRAWNEVQQGFDFVKELDTTLTTIYETMDITKQGLAELGNGAIQMGKDLGAAGSEVMDSVDIYAAYGETVDSILTKASPTVMLANAAQSDVRTASEQIQAVVQQYKELEGQETKVVNAYEKIAANVQIDFPKGIQTIAEAVQTAGSVAEDAGLRFEDFGASVAKVAERTRMEGSVIGNAYKTILARTSRSKSADDDVSAEDRGEAAKALSNIGIDVYNDKGEYQDFSKTLDELANKWDTLTDAQRANVAEGMAGVRNINVMQGIIETWNEAKSLGESTNQDSEYYLEVQEKYMESIQAKLNTLRASLQEFWNSILDTGVINLGIEGLTTIVNLAESILGVFGSIKESIGGLAGSITSLSAAAATAYASFKAFQNIKSTGTLLGGLSKTGSDAKSGIGGIFGTVTSLFSKEGRKTLFGGLKDIANEYNELSKGGAAGILESFGAAGGGIEGLSAGFGALAGKIGISTTALLGFTGAFAAIGVGIALFNQFTDSTEETAKAVEDLNAKYKETQSTFKSNRETIDSIGLEWEVLSQGVDSFGNNISLTTEEFSRYHELCNQIAEMYPNLVSSYDAQGNAILNLKGNLQELNDEYERQVAAESRRRLDEDASTYQENFNNITGNRAWNTEIADNFGNLLGSAEVGGRITAKEALDALKEIQGKDIEEVQKYLKELNSDYSGNGQDILSYLMGDEIGIKYNMDSSEWGKISKNIVENINSLNAEVEAAASDMRTIMQDYLNTLTLAGGQYSNLDDELVQQISSMFSKTSADQLKKLEDEGIELEDYINNFVGKLSNSKDAQVSLDNLLSIDENTNIEDIKKTLEEDIEKLSKTLEIDGTELKVQLGLTDEEELVKKYDTVVNNAKKKIESDNKTKLDELLKEADKKADASDLSSRLGTEIYKENRDGIGEKKKFNYASTYYDEDKNQALVLTPVLPNGEILSQEELDAYATDILNGKEVDADITLATFKGKDAIKQANQLTKETNKLSKAYDSSAEYADQLKDYIKDNKINTQEQLDLLNQCVQETDSWAEATRQFELKDINLEANANVIEQLEANLKTVEENIQKINEATDQSHESMGLTGEQIDNVVNAFSGLKGYNYDKLFESTAAGVHLNVQELERLNGEYEKTEKAKYTDTLSDLEDQYGRLCIQIEEANTVTEKNELITQRNNLEKQIEEVQELASRYDGLTNSVTKFQQAMEGGEEGDTYDYIAESAEEIERLYDEGLTGTRKFKSYVQMMTDEDMSGKSNKEYIDMYEKQKKLFESMFTEDSAVGAQNFLKQLTKIEDESGRAMASYDKLNDSWKINNADAAEIAKELGVSEGAIAEIFKKLSDFGFEIDFTEETDHLKAMREEAEKANKEFNDFSKFKGFEDFKFDLKVTDPEALREQIDDAEKLREVLISTYGDGSDEVKKFDSQLDYLKATAGQTIDALDFSLNYNDNKDEIDGLIGELKKLEEYKDMDFNFDTTSVTNVDNQMSEVVTKLQELQSSDGRINLEANGAAELMDIFIALINKKSELSRPAVATLDINDFSGNYQSVMTMIQDYQTAVENLNKYEALAKVDVKYESAAEDAKAEVDKAVQAINNSSGATAKILTDLELKPGSLTQEKIDAQLAGLDANMMIKAGFKLTDEAKQAMGGATADATKKIDADTTDADAKVTALENDIKKEVTKPIKLSVNTTTFDEAISDRTKTSYKTIVVNEKAGTKVSGTGKVSGTAHVKGNAFAGGTSGKWGLPKDDTALVGELGQELVVDPKTSEWYVVGENGAEFRDLKKGQIVFNHKQTEEIFKNGYINSRGKALLKGTVGKLNSLFKVGSGSAYAGGYSGSGQFGYSGSGKDMWTNNKDKDKNNDKKEQEPKESDFDWIEVAIQRIEEAISRLDIAANSAYKSLTGRNSTLSKEFSKVTEQIQLQQKAYEAYMREANSIGLSSTYVNKIKNGTMDVETIVDNEELVEKINKYQELYDKAIESKDAILELEETLGDLAQSRFDNVVSLYDAQLSEIEHRIEMIEGGLDMVEAKGNLAGKEYYEALMNTERQNISKLSDEYNALQNEFNNAMNSGAIEKNSEAFYNMQEQIRDVEKALQDAKISLIEYQNQMREMDWTIFEKMIDYQTAITDESDFIRELMSFNDNDLFNKDTGQLSNKGQAVGGLHAVDYNVYMAQADEYRKKVEEINAELAKDPTNTTLLDKKQEYLEAQREAILNAEDEKQAIKDLISDSYERMLDILQELIDKRKEALEAEKDLYDYQKNVEEQAKNITDLRKQLTALQGDDSEEAKSKRQQLEDQLKNAESDLEETEYDKWIDDQQRLMDDYYSQFEEYLNARLDNIDGLMQEMIDNTNANSSTIDQTIKDTTSDVGYKVTDGMNNIWNNTGSGIGKIVADYSSNFDSKLTTTNNYMKSINELVAKIVNKSVTDIKDNTGGVVTGGSSGSSGGSSSGNSSNNKPSSNSNSKPKGWFFKYKKDSYPKNKLQINTSIVDRMKYHDFDSSFSARRTAYAGMGLGSASSYTGSYKQNTAMISWMRKNGYSKGGTIGSLVKRSGEDGFVLAKSGEEILSLDKLEFADNMVSNLIDFAKFMPDTSAIGNTVQEVTSNSEVNLNLTLPNVKDSQSFIREIQTNKQVQQALVDVTIGRALGKNSLNVNKRK